MLKERLLKNQRKERKGAFGGSDEQGKGSIGLRMFGLAWLGLAWGVFVFFFWVGLSVVSTNQPTKDRRSPLLLALLTSAETSDGSSLSCLVQSCPISSLSLEDAPVDAPPTRLINE